MKPVIAILTYNRVKALKRVLAQVLEHCPNYEIAIFDDYSLEDETRDYILARSEKDGHADILMADRYVDKKHPNVSYYMGYKNLGVAGNSNRAISKFYNVDQRDTLFLCNDDLLVKGDFTKPYVDAIEKTGIQNFCFCNFTSPQYRWSEMEYKGVTLKRLSRMTGSMITVTRKLVDRIGFMDTRLGRFGEEHCDYTNRASHVGMVSINDEPQYCLDIVHDMLDMQHDIASCIPPAYRKKLDAFASLKFKEISAIRPVSDCYVEFNLMHIQTAGARNNLGIPVDDLSNYAKINGFIIDEEHAIV